MGKRLLLSVYFQYISEVCLWPANDVVSAAAGLPHPTMAIVVAASHAIHLRQETVESL